MNSTTSNTAAADTAITTASDLAEHLCRQTAHLSTHWLLVMLLTICTLASGINASAQTEYQIKTRSDDLKQEYEDELNKWMLLAYEGDSEAQFRVGVLFANQQFGEADLEQAVYWYKQASRQGHALAQYNLGHHFLTGNGVEKNESNATKWWLEAANNEHALSQFNIGRAYYLGIGLAQDHQQSRFWFERAAQNGEPKSIEILQQLGWDDGTTVAQVTPDQATTTSTAAPLTSRITPVETNKTAATPVAIPPAITPAKEVNAGVPPVSTPAPPPETPPTATTVKPNTTANRQSKWVTDTAKPTKTVAAQTAVSESSAPSNNTINSKSSTTSNKPVALYTNPDIKNVLITIIDNRESLQIISTNQDWVSVTSPTGFPVWMHRDYLQINDGMATVSGNNVNARSVPIISRGTVVGTLNKGEQVKVIDQQNAWYRVMSPPSFVAWVKTDDYNK